jgi:hypothetical protein
MLSSGIQLVFHCNLLQLLVTTNVVLSLLILFTLMIEVIFSSEMSVLTRATWHYISEGIILQSSHSYAPQSTERVVNYFEQEVHHIEAN